jgi:hypothetical protein
MKVLRISAKGSDPLQLDPPKVEEFKFDKHQLWRYDVVRRIGNKVFIAERYAKYDYLGSNTIANQLADRLASKEHSSVRAPDTVNNPPKKARRPKKLHGPVMVARYDRLLDIVTHLSDHDITDLTENLKLIDPLIKVERLDRSPDVVSRPERTLTSAERAIERAIVRRTNLAERQGSERPHGLNPCPPLGPRRPSESGPDAGGLHKGLG